MSFAPEIKQPFRIGLTDFRPEDNPEQYRQKLAGLLLDAISGAAGLLNREGIVLECNRAALAMGGLVRAKALGKPLWETYSWADPERAEQDFRRAVQSAANRETVECEGEISAGLELIETDWTLRPILSEQGRVVLILFEAQSAHVRVDNHAPERAKAQWQAIWKAGAFTARLDLKGNVEDASPAGVEDCGYARPEIVGRPFWECGWWARSPELREWARRAVQLALSGAPFRGESRYFLADGTERAIDLVCTPVRDESGRLFCVSITGLDVTERHQAERLWRADAESQAKLNELKTGFFANIGSEFRTFADAVPAMLWLAGPDASCAFFSRAWSEYTGQPQEEALGFGWLDAVHAEDREELRRAYIAASASHAAFHLDCRLRTADGQYRWAVIHGHPRFTATGQFTGFTGAVVDVHERRQSAQASALLTAIVDSCDDAIISKNLNGRITSWNKSAERLFGYTAQEAIGQSIEILIPPERRNEEPKILERLRRGIRVDHFETVRVRKDGTHLNISLTISPVRDASGRIIGASKVARDITEQVRQEKKLLETNAALERANADLQQFAYSASHDLQEPLRMVAAYSELLQRRYGDQLGAVGQEYIKNTVQGALRMESLLKDLRTYTHLSTIENEPPAEVEADEVLKKALFNLDVAIKNSGAEITSTPLPRLSIYEFQLEQLFQNLIGNAIRYRREAPPKVHIAAELQGNEWLFSVRDNGIGIEPQFREHIFGIFKRLHSGGDCPGTGLGLAICKRVVERTGGRIWVESEPGRGSTFYFTVPFGNDPGGTRACALDSAD